MTTVINNPPTTPATSSDTGGNNGMGFLIGTIILVAFFAILLYFGLPYLKNMSSPQINIPAPQINVPEQVDVNVNQTE